MAPRAPGGNAAGVAEPLIERDEIVALLFNVSDLVVGVHEIIYLLGGGDDEEAEADGS